MVEHLEVTGMVLSAMPIGDYDKRLVILTKERGKISVFAKGARRQNSPFMAGSRPFSFGKFTLYEGRNSYGLTNVAITNYFTELSSDFENAYYGFYFLELADYFGREGIEAAETLNLLYASFLALKKHNIKNILIRYIYELKTLVINGEYPSLFSCLYCGSKENLLWFDESKNGIYCTNCKEYSKYPVKLENSTLYALQFIISKPIKELFTFTVSDAVLKQIKEFAEYYMRQYVQKEFKSLEILENM